MGGDQSANDIMMIVMEVKTRVSNEDQYKKSLFMLRAPSESMSKSIAISLKAVIRQWLPCLLQIPMDIVLAKSIAAAVKFIYYTALSQNLQFK